MHGERKATEKAEAGRPKAEAPLPNLENEEGAREPVKVSLSLGGKTTVKKAE